MVGPLFPSFSVLIYLPCLLWSTDINVGFSQTTYNASEDETVVEICVAIFDGILGPGITLDYLISAPRVDTTQSDGLQSDTAVGNATVLLALL